jgi:hypothetical protein
MMKPGTQVVHVPVLAAGDINHPDCWRGFIAGPPIGRSIYVYIWKELGVSLRTTRPQLTDSEHLVAADSVEQMLVEVWLP